jgi:hypothetical protein
VNSRVSLGARAVPAEPSIVGLTARVHRNVTSEISALDYPLPCGLELPLGPGND